MRPKGILSVVLCLAGAGCATPRVDPATPFQLSSHEWREVYADSSYVVSLDVAHVDPGPEADTLAVWYETRHLALREHEGQPWNREVIRSLLRCEPLSFKTVRTTIFLDDGPPIAQLAKSPGELSREAWRPVGSGSVDEGALRGACGFLMGRSPLPG